MQKFVMQKFVDWDILAAMGSLLSHRLLGVAWEKIVSINRNTKK